MLNFACQSGWMISETRASDRSWPTEVSGWPPCGHHAPSFPFTSSAHQKRRSRATGRHCPAELSRALAITFYLAPASQKLRLA